MSYRQKILLICIILCFQFSGYAAESKTNSDALESHNILAEFSIPTGGDIILLPVKFKGKEYSFVLDTGTSVTAFEASFKPELGSVKETTKVKTAADTMIVEFFDAPESSLGPLNLQDCGQVACVDLRMLGFVVGREISGVLGMNFLQKYIIQIDFDEGKLLFIQPTHSPDNDWGEALKITCDSLGHPWVKGFIFDTINVDFLIDTGLNASGELDAKILEDIPKGAALQTSETLTQTPSSTLQKTNFRFNNLSIGSSKYENTILRWADMSSLGLQFLSRHIVTLDFPNNKLYFKKGRDFNKTDEVDMSGLHLLRMSNQTIVHSVDEGSPSERAGVRANDVILSVKNKDADKYDMQELRRFLKSGDKNEINMTIKRGNDLKEVSFLLEKKI